MSLVKYQTENDNEYVTTQINTRSEGTHLFEFNTPITGTPALIFTFGLVICACMFFYCCLACCKEPAQFLRFLKWFNPRRLFARFLPGSREHQLDLELARLGHPQPAVTFDPTLSPEEIHQSRVARIRIKQEQLVAAKAVALCTVTPHPPTLLETKDPVWETHSSRIPVLASTAAVDAAVPSPPPSTPTTGSAKMAARMALTELLPHFQRVASDVALIKKNMEIPSTSKSYNPYFPVSPSDSDSNSDI